MPVNLLLIRIAIRKLALQENYKSNLLFARIVVRKARFGRHHNLEIWTALINLLLIRITVRRATCSLVKVAVDPSFDKNCHEKSHLVKVLFNLLLVRAAIKNFYYDLLFYIFFGRYHFTYFWYELLAHKEHALHVKRIDEVPCCFISIQDSAVVCKAWQEKIARKIREYNLQRMYDTSKDTVI